MAKKQVFEYFFNRLVNGYRSVMGKNPEGLDLIKIKQEARQKTIDQDKIIKFPQPKSFGQEVDEMIKKGEVNIGEAPKTKSYTPSKSQTDFEIQERLNSDNKKAIKAFEERIKNKPLDPNDVLPDSVYNETPGAFTRRNTPGSKENLLQELKIAYEKEFNRLRGDETAEELKEILKNLDIDGVPFASGGRAGYYMGGQAMVGEDLSEIGHGSDSLMARNMQLAPNSMATTSTGLNYLLGQDNDTARVPYNKGKFVKGAVDKGRRGFMKAAGATTAGIAALKTGLLGFGEKVAPVAKETVEAATSAIQGVPPYFFKLVEKIKNFGVDTPKLAVKDREIVTTYKDYTLTEDVVTGEKTIQRMKIDDDLKYDASEYYGKPVGEETYMSYRPGKGQIDETTKGKTPPDEYTEDTSLIRSDRPAEGEIMDTFDGVPDDVIEEAMEKTIKIGKADGGRIGFNKGKFVKDQLIKAGEGKFTKAQYLIERIKNTIKGSPDDEYVQKTFPGFIKELEVNPDLAKNENVFKELGGDLPEGQQIVVYGDDTLDFFTTSSGPQNIQKLENFMAKHDLPKDQALRIMKMEPNDQVMELTKTKFLKQKRTDNSSGGLAAMLGE